MSDIAAQKSAEVAMEHVHPFFFPFEHTRMCSHDAEEVDDLSPHDRPALGHRDPLELSLIQAIEVRDERQLPFDTLDKL